MQLLGRKRWILRKPNFEFPLYMQQTKNFPDIKEPEEIYMDVILEAGDILYIPRGWWHDPLPLDEETFHLAVATFAPLHCLAHRVAHAQPSGEHPRLPQD